jgi:hypothetical protein
MAQTTVAQGKCLCGAIKFTLVGEPDKSIVCYCSDCRKGSGSIGQFMSEFDTVNVHIEDPQSKMTVLNITQTASGIRKEKHFCASCGCTILTKPMRHHGKKVFVRTVLVDEGYERFIPQSAIFTAEKPSFVQVDLCVDQ